MGWSRSEGTIWLNAPFQYYKNIIKVTVKVKQHVVIKNDDLLFP